ncbi:MAG: D-glycero-beta-D-manno-heptose-7-phosphate kinase [Alphaproteobacteria bacterium]|nr:D-glycero-beta-D-manno-heptose-7-phosphate kinase [Alphaproteobacteria bacterium]
MQNTPVLVIGDIMLDRFIYGRVDRISPESPVPVLSIKREDSMLGGAGNALANLAGLKAKGLVISVIGDDSEGAQLREKAQEMGADISGLVVDSARPTIVKTRYLAGHQQLLRSDYESSAALSETIEAQLIEKAKQLIPDAKAVILSDYGKGLLTETLIAAVMNAANAAGVPVIVDPKGQDFSKYKGARAITPNKKELSEATRGLPVDTDEQVIAAAQTLIESCGIDAVVATRSAEGMSVIEANAAPVHFETVAQEVFDVSGAGDTVIATIAAGLAAGADLADAAALANVAGGVVVAKVGTAPIRADELAAALEGEQKAGLSAPVCNWDEAAEHVKRWKAKGLKTGFTNGCFDIVHLGHVSYLNDARAKCDRLIVGLNADSSVKILKGPSRPVHDEASRAAVLAALAAVDMVVLFGATNEGEDNTACDLLSKIQPDIYFKGGDYTVDQIPEAPSVQSYGGVVEVMPVYEGHSTTASIKKASDEAA